jgi:hypothetical protein
LRQVVEAPVFPPFPPCCTLSIYVHIIRSLCPRTTRWCRPQTLYVHKTADRFPRSPRKCKKLIRWHFLSLYSPISFFDHIFFALDVLKDANSWLKIYKNLARTISLLLKTSKLAFHRDREKLRRLTKLSKNKLRLCRYTRALTLIWMAGSTYDSQNFGEIQLKMAEVKIFLS